MALRFFHPEVKFFWLVVASVLLMYGCLDAECGCDGERWECDVGESMTGVTYLLDVSRAVAKTWWFCFLDYGGAYACCAAAFYGDRYSYANEVTSTGTKRRG